VTTTNTPSREFDGLPTALKKFFGPKPGQKLVGFARELKALTVEDKRWFKAELIKLGYTIGT